MAAVWVRDLTDDWAIVKKEIMNELDDEHRAMFSRRDDKTKEHGPPNPLEEEILSLWKELTGVSLRRRAGTAP